MRVAILTTDSREHFKDYDNPVPYFGTAPEALLQGLTLFPDAEVHVLSCIQRQVSSPGKIAGNIWYHGLHVPKVGWMRTLYAGCTLAHRRKLRELQPDLVHGQGTERDCAIGALLSGFPNVVTIHGNQAELARLFRARPFSFSWLAGKLENYTLRRTAGVFCNSEYTENLVRPRARRTWRAANPLRLPFFEVPRRSRGSAKPVVVNVGLISPRKRQLELLEVISRLRRKGLEFEMHFVGVATPGSPYAGDFLKRIEAPDLKDCVRYLGTKSTAELIDIFDSGAGMIHFPSEEAFGLVVAEGLARDLKFFGSRTGGIIDICAGVPGAELFDLEDWAGLEAGLEDWLRAGAARPSGAAAIMEQRYHPRVIARRHLEIYREVLGRKVLV